MELKRHFPILFLFFLLIGCQQKQENLFSTKYDTLIDKGKESLKKEDYNKAYYYFYKANESCYETEKDRKLYALNMMADIQNKQSDFIGVEKTVTDALAIKENSTYSPGLYVLLAIAYEERGDYENALKYYHLNLRENKKANNILIIKNNIAVVYLEKKEYRKAATILEPLLSNDTLNDDLKEYAKIMDNLGYAYFKMKDVRALPYLNKALHIRDSLKEDYERTASLMHLSEFHLNDNPKLSNDYAFKAYQAATKVKSPDDRLEALDFLIKNATGNDFKPYYLIHSKLNDSISKVRLNAKTEFAKIKYDNEKALDESAKASKDAELQKTQKYIYILLIILIIGIGTYILSAFRKKSREKMKTVSYETETRIAKKIHDELANDVFNALTYADTQNLSDPEKKETLIENLDIIYARARNLSHENDEIDTGENYPKHLTDLLIQYDSYNVSVIINNLQSVQWNSIKKEIKITLYRIIQELMVNMKKHSDCTAVVIGFTDHKSKIEIQYSDNGKGTEMLKSKKGLQNAENRIDALKGKITFDIGTGKGFKAIVEIPK